MNEADTPEAGPAHSLRGERGQFDPVVVADNHVFDETPAVDHKADLPRNLPGKVHDLFGQIKGDDLGWLYPSCVKIEEPSFDEVVEPLGITVYVDDALYALATSSLSISIRAQ